MGRVSPRLILRTFARRYVFSSPTFVRSFLPPSGNIFFTRKRRSRKRERAPLRYCLLRPRLFHRVFAAWPSICARAHTMFKALPVIFRGVSAYLYRPRFRFYIASHRYAPQGTPASRAILSHDKRAINFCETAPSRPASAFHACTRMSLSPLCSTANLCGLLLHVARVKQDVMFSHKGAIVTSLHLENAYLRVLRWLAKTFERWITIIG